MVHPPAYIVEDQIDRAFQDTRTPLVSKAYESPHRMAGVFFSRSKVVLA